MYLSIRVVLYLLGNECIGTIGNVLPLMSVSGTHMLKPETERLNPGIIYICYLSDYLQYKDCIEPVVFACVNDISDMGDNSCSDNGKAGVLLFPNMELGELLLKIQTVFLRMERWNQKMIQSIMEKDLQKLLDSCKDVIENSIVINDSHFSLIAFTLSQVNDERELSEAVNARAFGRDLINRFINANVLEDSRNQQGIEIKTSHRYSKYDLATCTVMVDDSYFLRVAMSFDQKPMTDGLVDLFALLLEQIKVYVKCVPGISSVFKEKYGVFFLDLVNAKVTDPAVIHMRAESCGIDPQSMISVYLIVFQESPDKNYLDSFFEKLRRMWPSARIIPRENDLVIVAPETEKELIANGFYHNLSTLLEQYKAICGFSSHFKGIESVRNAYHQASLAIKYGMQIRDRDSEAKYSLLSRNNNNSACLFSYETYYLYALYDHDYHENQALFGNTESVRLLYAIWTSDRRDNMNDLQLLYEYLKNGRRATETAKAIHMHRNSVLYRVDKLERDNHVDFSDSELCFKILLAYRLLDYYGDFYFGSMTLLLDR